VQEECIYALFYHKMEKFCVLNGRLNRAQMQYTSTERESLSVVETLKEVGKIVLGKNNSTQIMQKQSTNNSMTTEL
jgi:hypothetical protein